MERLILFIILIFFSSCKNDLDQNFFINTLGLNIDIKQRYFSLDEGVNPQNEGFSMDVFLFERRDESNIFLNSDSYPKKYSIRENWKVKHWDNAPLLNKDVLELLFNHEILNSDLKKNIERLKEASILQTNFVSYYYKENNGYIYAIDFYLIDVEQKKIYICEVFT